MKFLQPNVQGESEERQQASTSGSSRTRLNRAAIFVDAEYFRISCLGEIADGFISSTSKLIKYVQDNIEGVQHIDRWRCFAYDAKYVGRAESFAHPADRVTRKKMHRMLLDAGFTVRFGSYVLRDIRVVGDVKSTRVIVQKEVDTMIVVDAMREAFTVGADTLIFITGDSDFIPLFRELRVRKKTVILLHGDENTVSQQLIRTSSQALQIVRTSGYRSVQQRLSNIPAVAGRGVRAR